jgi:hypothetical protein
MHLVYCVLVVSEEALDWPAHALSGWHHDIYFDILQVELQRACNQLIAFRIDTSHNVG